MAIVKKNLRPAPKSKAHLPAGVQIVRKRGRIAGFAKPKVPASLLWCGTNRPRKRFGERADGWSFPPAVREFLLQECKGKTVLHLFGGKADFGTRLDVDPSTKPDVVGDAWIAFRYFRKNSFDVVILDPPYMSLNQQEKVALLTNAAWLARDLVIWFSPVTIDTDRSLKEKKFVAVRVGTQCAMRCIQVFAVDQKQKRRPVTHFQRGPAMIYNRWHLDEKGRPRQKSLFAEIAIDANPVDVRKSTIAKSDIPSVGCKSGKRIAAVSA